MLGLVAVSVVVVGLVVGVVTNVATNELPGWLDWLTVGSRAWWLLLALLVLGAGLAVLPRASRYRYRHLPWGSRASSKWCTWWSARSSNRRRGRATRSADCR